MNKTKLKKDIAYEKIRSWIINGKLLPGQRLIVDEIKDQLSLGISPIREAIHKLEVEGFVINKPFRGAIVSSINDKDYQEILYTLSILEGFASTISFPLFPEEKKTELINKNIEAIQAIENFNFEEFIKCNREFHEMTLSFCPNKFLSVTIEQMWMKLESVRRLRSSYFPTVAREDMEEHKKIISFISNDNFNKEYVETFIRNHHLRVFSTN